MLPLKDKTVLITRSAIQAEDFINQLQEKGATTVTLPLIENTPINQDKLKDTTDKESFDWLIFTSANAVKFFFDIIPIENVNSKIAVVGSKTAQLIKEIGLNIDFIPSKFTAKHLGNEIPTKPGESILIPQSILAKPLLVEILESKKCKVEGIPIYDNHPISYTKGEVEKIFSKPIDFITFTSGSIIKSFITTNIKLNDEKIICIGSVTARVAEKYNLEVSAIANPHTIEGMVKAILEN